MALEYMVALSNAINASAWFCMPRTNAMAEEAMVPPNQPGAADEADLRAYASYVKANLAPWLTVFVEYRTDALSRNEAPQTHAIESLEVWKAWKLEFGVAASHGAHLGKRLVRVSAEGPWLRGTLQKFGTDIVNVDAVALRTTFGVSSVAALMELESAI